MADDDPTNCKRWTMIRLFATALTHVRIDTPRDTALRMIAWYQANVSAGRNLCGRPFPYNCSERAAWFIRSYGLLVGGMFAFLVTFVGDCRGAEEPEPDRSCAPDCGC